MTIWVFIQGKICRAGCGIKITVCYLIGWGRYKTEKGRKEGLKSFPFCPTTSKSWKKQGILC